MPRSITFSEAEERREPPVFDSRYESRLAIFAGETLFADAGVRPPEVVALDGVDGVARTRLHAFVLVRLAVFAVESVATNAFVGAGEILTPLRPPGVGTADTHGVRALVALLHAFVDVQGAGHAFPAFLADALRSDSRSHSDFASLRPRLAALAAAEGVRRLWRRRRLRRRRPNVKFVVASHSKVTCLALTPRAQRIADRA